MTKICIFAGTSEGRDLLTFLAGCAVQCTACVATEYGETLLDTAHTTVHTGRMDKAEMCAFLRAEGFSLVIDATHPYAHIVTENIVGACTETGIEYLRIVRADVLCANAQEAICDNSGKIVLGTEGNPHVHCTRVASTAQAVSYLATTQGNILSTIGSKELDAFSGCDFQDRLYARVLPLDAALTACQTAKIAPSHIIAMQGPFSYALNRAMIAQYDIKILLTKDGGAAGGFAEKLQIAQDMGLELVLIEKPAQVEGYSLDAAKALLWERFAPKTAMGTPLAQDTIPTQTTPSTTVLTDKTVSIIACGVGAQGLLTAEARTAIAKADVLIGAKRLLAEFSALEKPSHAEINSEKIATWIRAHAEYQHVAVLFTGDIGFFSGAKKLYSALSGMHCVPICGISSPIYLCAKLQMPWEDVTLVSLHGRTQNILSAIQTNPKVFTLLGGEHTAETLCTLLCAYDLGHLELCIGENLSYPNEKITKGTAQALLGQHFDTLSCALIFNENANNTLRFGLEDDAFVRVPKVPMTKAEVRAVSIAKLQLSPQSIAYDVGAGTGSISIEMALCAQQGHVYAIEKNTDALTAIAQNKKLFKTDHLTIIEGLAPDCMADLPAPTHVFIGGSSGNLQEIVDLVLRKNPAARFVVNTVTLETLSEAMALAKTFEKHEIVEIASAKAKTLGKYHLMTANNPIYIITFQNTIS